MNERIENLIFNLGRLAEHANPPSPRALAVARGMFNSMSGLGERRVLLHPYEKGGIFLEICSADNGFGVEFHILADGKVRVSHMDTATNLTVEIEVPSNG